ncbi:MAG: LCP family protein [Arcanobacterium sp.]|nr:LCP family protein [Arcanobacterium sp.]
MEQFPSFTPRSTSKSRPATTDAKKVGQGTAPKISAPAKTTDTPVSIPPKRSTTASRPTVTNSRYTSSALRLQQQNLEQPENPKEMPQRYLPQERRQTPPSSDSENFETSAEKFTRRTTSPTLNSTAGAQNSEVESNSPRLRIHRPRKIFRKILIFFLILILLACFWLFYLVHTGNKNLSYSDALSGRADTPGTTYLIVGSDERTANEDSTEGQRSDSIMLLHKNGNQSALISLPRDSFVEIPGQGGHKINAAFSLGGAPLLVQTVENLTGLTIDHYIQIGMNGLVELTDAVGGVNLCYDQDVNDEKSHLNWTAGCHDVDGETALAFARMRYSDPLGDIGRAQRQRQVVSAILKKAASKETILSPSRQYALTKSGAQVLGVDNDTSITDVAWAGWYIKQALGSSGVMGTPPISDLNYYPGGIGSTVRLDPERIDQFWIDLRDGNLSADKYETLVQK